MIVRRLYSVAAVAAVCLTTLGTVGATPATAAPAAPAGPTWTITPSASTAATDADTLYGVSCTSPTRCVAVGNYYDTRIHTLAEVWNGANWTMTPGPDPSPGSDSGLAGVSCTSVASCVAVGFTSAGSARQTLIETWNGSAWTVAAGPSNSPTQGSELGGVSCTSATACVAVGDFLSGSVFQTLIETWNGTAWSIAPSPNTSSTLNNNLSGVSCTSPTACVAVGSADNGTSGQTLIETWNGTAWTITPSPNTSATLNNFLAGVSCSLVTACVAVGSADNGTTGQTLIESWNGTAWTITPSPNTSSTLDNNLSGVSCSSPTACVAVGNADNGTYGQTLIESWNGTAWTITPSPNASTVFSNYLQGASCTAATACVAVGKSDNGPGAQTLAMSAVAPGGYRLVASDGGIFAYGGSPFLGSMGGMPLNQPIVGMAATADDQGYWLVAADGGVFAYGSARFYGSMGATRLNKPIVGMAAAPDGKGYWLVASDGGIFAFGSAAFAGSAGGIRLAKPVVGMAATADGKGYWLAASDGGVFSYGTATFKGSTVGKPLNAAVVGISTSPIGTGYWLVAADGGVFSFGDAAPHGSAGGLQLNKPIVGMTPDQTGNGYWLVATDGGVFAYGDAPFAGSTGNITLNKPIVGAAG